jgi:hypothetical protein
MIKNVVIYADSEEQMQGIIRGIEQLDTEHEISIIYGTYTEDVLSEPIKVLIDVAQAVVIDTGRLDKDDTDSLKRYVLRHVPNDAERNDVIDWLITNHKHIIQDLKEL